MEKKKHTQLGKEIERQMRQQTDKEDYWLSPPLFFDCLKAICVAKYHPFVSLSIQCVSQQVLNRKINYLRARLRVELVAKLMLLWEKRKLLLFLVLFFLRFLNTDKLGCHHWVLHSSQQISILFYKTHTQHWSITPLDTCGLLELKSSSTFISFSPLPFCSDVNQTEVHFKRRCLFSWLLHQ